MTDFPPSTDDATGLPPLGDVDPDATILVVDWAAGIGIATLPGSDVDIPCRYLSVRGVTRAIPGDPLSAEWAQFHLAVPVAHAVDVAAALAAGGTFDDDNDD